MASFTFRAYAPPPEAATTNQSQPPPAYIPAHQDASIQGSFAFDKENGYTFHWKNLEEANVWRIQEEKTNMIELIHKETRLASSGMEHLWSKRIIYVCSRGSTGGKSHYIKKHDRSRKIPNKRVDCQCRLLIKVYPHTKEVLGRYNDLHTHEVGNSNARFTRLRKETREEIERLLRLGVEPRKVLEQVQGKIYSEKNASALHSENSRRHEFCTRADVRRIEKMIEEETIRLAGQDGPSVLQWVAKLKSEGHYVELKTANNDAPPGTRLAPDAFVLIIQTKYQRECWEKHGHRFTGIDATHNTTHYENMNLFTLYARDRWGHGIPTAWMISSNGTAETIAYFLQSIRRQSPGVLPKYFMSDKDRAELNAIESVYPESKIFLCWWHVLHAWQQHFVTTHFPELWDLLKKWIRIQDQAEFDAMWEKIKSIAPKSVVDYLQTNWMNETHLWSAVFRADRTVFDDCDTNMLVEAWHHLLKGTFMEGKRNRRLDHLIHVLVEKAMPYFMHRHRRQELGFEGPDLEVKKRIEITARSKSVLASNITPTLENDVYMVKSSIPGIEYRVDLEAYDCTCLSFPTIRFCKHIAAVEREYSVYDTKIQPVTALDIHPLQSIDLTLPTSHTTVSSGPETSKDTELVNQLSQLAIRLQDAQFFADFLADHADVLLSLQESVRDATTSSIAMDNARKSRKSEGMLPKTEGVAPNQHSWPETAAVMGVSVKSKRKAYTDAHSGGGQSGKKAKSDARKPPQKDAPLLATPGPITISSLNPVHYMSTSTHLSIPNTFVPSSSSSMALSHDPFNPATVDLQDVAFLKTLKRDKLYKVCFYHNIPAAGRNVDIIAHLQSLKKPL